MPRHLREYEQFFFEGMSQGWAAGNDGEAVPELPHARRIVSMKGRLVLIDQWLYHPTSGKGGGTTTMWDDGIPVWKMWYGGRCADEAVPIVRKALLAAYQSQRFVGGRGVERLEEARFTYVNHTDEPNQFDRFSGEEESSRSFFDEHTLQWEWDTSAYHWYRGMSLV
ncbi:MAG: hypothetical protein HY340_03585 [Candidatus Kerfeldbacteria bacterium]|nr:hypothetical protein [Candidatus Kerfeldbacteria bacterium]